MRGSRAKLLLIADVPGWIFERHCWMLNRYLSDEFDITVTYEKREFTEDDYDLIYPLEWYMLEDREIRQPEKYVTGIRSHLIWPELEFSTFVDKLNTNFGRVHVVSQRLYEIFQPHVSRLSYTTHGVDTAMFSPDTIAGAHDGSLKIGWAGNRKSRGNKGYADIITPLQRIPGVELSTCGYADKNLTLAEMRAFYDSIDVYVCASTNFEGNNNSLLEAASMARAIVTTDNGTVPEYLVDEENALILERDQSLFADAVIKLREDRPRIATMGQKAQEVVRTRWDWKLKAEDYRAFFREALAS